MRLALQGRTAAEMALCANLALRGSTQLQGLLLVASLANTTAVLPPALTARQENTAIPSLDLPSIPCLVGLAVQESTQQPLAMKPSLFVCCVLQGLQAQILAGPLHANLAPLEKHHRPLGLDYAPAALQAPFPPLLAL